MLTYRMAKLWRCGDPYRYPFPEAGGDPWNSVLEPYRKNDKIQCEAWKDEVQNLLIFVRSFLAFRIVYLYLNAMILGWFILCSRHSVHGGILQESSTRSK